MLAVALFNRSVRDRRRRRAHRGAIASAAARIGSVRDGASAGSRQRGGHQDGDAGVHGQRLAQRWSWDRACPVFGVALRWGCATTGLVPRSSRDCVCGIHLAATEAHPLGGPLFRPEQTITGLSPFAAGSSHLAADRLVGALGQVVPQELLDQVPEVTPPLRRPPLQNQDRTGGRA
jgi:hypothetical protein